MILPNPYVKIPRCFAPLYAVGSQYTVYINLDMPAYNFDESQYLFGLLGDGTIPNSSNPSFSYDIANISKDTLDDGTFNLYVQNFTFPTANDGYYRFAVYNINTLAIIAVSSLVQVNSLLMPLTVLLEYNNGDEDIFGYGFSRIQGLQFTQHVQLYQTNAQPETDSKVYRNVTNVATDRWRSLGSYRDTVYTAEVYYFDAAAHEAMQAALDMSHVYFNHRRVQYKAGTYRIETVQNLNVYKASFDFYALDEYNAIVPDAWDGILPAGPDDYAMAYFGGTPPKVPAPVSGFDYTFDFNFTG